MKQARMLFHFPYPGLDLGQWRPASSAPVFEGAPMQIIATGLRYPEGPVALADGSVLVVELAGEALKRVRPDGRVDVVAKIPGSPNGAAMGPGGKVYVCNNGGLKFIDVGGTLRTNGQSVDY